MINPDPSDDTPGDGVDELRRRYGAEAAEAWMPVVSQFALGQGFALIVILVPDADGARLCHRLVSDILAPSGQVVTTIRPKDPAALRRLADRLLPDPPDAAPAAPTGAIWVESVTPAAALDHAAWQAAWIGAVASLNQQRNPLRRQFTCPLLLVIAPWMLPPLRDNAPDLWSVRALVARILPPQSGRQPDGKPAPRQKLAEAITLRGSVIQNADEAATIEASLRADRDKLLAVHANGLRQIAHSTHQLAISLWLQDRAAAAEILFRQALELAEQGGDSPTSRSITLGYLALAVADQGRTAEAETLFRQALELKEQGGDSPTSRGITLENLARTVADQGRTAEAETLFRQALELKTQGGDSPTSRSITLDSLARAVADQGRTGEAETLFRQALELKTQGGDNLTSRSITLGSLARAAADQGRTAEAEALFQQAQTLLAQAPPQ